MKLITILLVLLTYQATAQKDYDYTLKPEKVTVLNTVTHDTTSRDAIVIAVKRGSKLTIFEGGVEKVQLSLLFSNYDRYNQAMVYKSGGKTVYTVPSLGIVQIDDQLKGIITTYQ